MKANGPERGIEEQLGMFEREVAWQCAEVARVRVGRGWLGRLGRSQRRLTELSGRTQALLREYYRWLEREGVAEAVEEIIRRRAAEKEKRNA